MKIKLRTLPYQLLMVYPLINIVVCFIFRGDNMNIFSVAYSWIVILLVWSRSQKMNNKTFIIFIILAGTFVVNLVRFDMTGIVSCIEYITMIVFLHICSERYFSVEGFRRYFLNYDKLVLLIQIIYILVLLYYVRLFGLRIGWGTRVLQGPYNYPHTLSYILEFFVFQNVIIATEKKSKMQIFAYILIAIEIAMIFMTAIRTTLLSLLFLLVFLLTKFVEKKYLGRIIVVLGIGLIALDVMQTRGVFSALIIKNKLALDHATFSNGRGLIFISSLKALTTGKGVIFNSIFGIGMTKLTKSNLNLMNAAIHAHNDFIDVFVCFGIVNFIIYCYSLLNFSKKNWMWIMLTVGVLAFANGFFVYIDCVPLMIYMRLAFESETTAETKVAKYSKKNRRYLKKLRLIRKA